MNLFTRWFSRPSPRGSRAAPPEYKTAARTEPAAAIELHSDAPEDQARAGLHFGGLGLAGLLDCHSEWLRRLARSLDEKHEDLPVHLDSIVDDHNCALGRWLNSDIRERFGETPEYRDLSRRHHEFHRLAADICRCHNQGLHDVARWGLLRDLKARSEQLRQDLESFFKQHPL